MLRGINVSGQKKICMADLKSHLEELGWEGIRTYIQSGNIVFRTADGNPPQLAQKIRQKLLHVYGFEIPALVLEPMDLANLIDNNPFARDPETNRDRLYVTFLFDTPSEELVGKIRESRKTNEHFIIIGKTIFLYYPDGYGRAVMNNNAFEKGLKVEATTRNWKTINALFEMTR